MPSGELFKPDASEIEVDAILAYEAESFEYEDFDDDEDYYQKRRVLIGPSVDVTHPEFSRPNLPEETYRVKFVKVEKVVSGIKPGSNQPQSSLKTFIEERIFDHNGNPVEF